MYTPSTMSEYRTSPFSSTYPGYIFSMISLASFRKYRAMVLTFRFEILQSDTCSFGFFRFRLPDHMW